MELGKQIDSKKFLLEYKNISATSKSVASDLIVMGPNCSTVEDPGLSPIIQSVESLLDLESMIMDMGTTSSSQVSRRRRVIFEKFEFKREERVSVSIQSASANINITNISLLSDNDGRDAWVARIPRYPSSSRLKVMVELEMNVGRVKCRRSSRQKIFILIY